MSCPLQPAQTISLSFQALCPTQVPAPNPACLSPLLLPAPAWGCRLAWPPPSPTAMWKGEHHRQMPGLLGSAAGWAWDSQGWAPATSGRRACPLACLVSTPLLASSCVTLCPACVPVCIPALL